MLSVLKKYSKEERQGILASAALWLLPNPSLSDRERSETNSLYGDTAIQALSEIKKALGINLNDESEKAKSRINEYLNRELSRLILESGNIARVRARVGQKGALRPDLYQIELRDTVKQSIARRGLSAAHIELALQQPELLDHMFPEEENEFMPPVSLFCKTFRLSHNDLYALIVLAERNGATLLVNDAWQVFHSDVNLAMSKSAIAVLKSLVDKYGEQIEVGGKSAKLFLNETLPISPGQQNVPIYTHKSENKFKLEGSMLFRTYGNTRQSISIGVVFVLDAGRYYSDLKKHGIKIKIANPV